ncbi:MAG TPA: ABC transporter ATP-binding protein [Hyphomicrobiaceae bacterium]|nr:ABC transporter ATP-binding protein [Hyphomicrobiaceae bacterium]
MSLLVASGVVAGYGAQDEILKGVDLVVHAGEVVCIIGPNGAGKSTLLKAIAGLLSLKVGSVRLEGREISGLPAREISRLGLAYVPQEFNVFPTLSVRENLEIGGYIDRKAAARRIEGVLVRFPVLADKQRHAARALSGGERQMLAMAMALMVEPVVLLLDEPSAGLSPRAAERLFDAVVEIHKDGIAVAIVEQNANEALAIADRAYILVDGKNSRTGAASALAADPEIRRLFLGA